ncbi:MAG: recombinase family protein [Candidatus Hydrogenedentota bacterium]
MDKRAKIDPTDKRVGIWIRVSTEDQARGESPQHHEQRARYYAEAKGWQVIEVYHLEGVSGKAVKEHPESKRMLADLDRGTITGLIFSKLARLARSTRDLLDFADIFQAHGADLISLQEAIDTSTAAGRLFFTIVAAMAEWERAEIAERVAASVPIRAKLGKPLGGKAPYGYQWKSGKLTTNPDETPVRKLIYDLFLQHRRKMTVARLLNDAGHRTRNGGLWSDSSVDRLLRDPTAKGVRRANYTKNSGDENRRTLKPESEWVLTEVEAIVSEDVWNQCNLILEDQRKKLAKRPGKKPVHLFAGLAICHCGQKMYVPSNTPKYVCQKCRNKIPIQDLEGVFYEELKGFFHSPDDISELLADANQEIADREQLLDKLEREKVQVQSHMDELFDLHHKGEIPTEGFGKRYNPLQERLNQLEDEIPRLQAEIDYLKVNLLSADDVLFEAKDLYDRWPRLEPDDRRRIVEHITDQIVIGKDVVEINLAYLPVSGELVANSPRNPSAASG